MDLVALFKVEERVESIEYTDDFRNMAIMFDISPKNLYIPLKYLGGPHNPISKRAMFFNPRKIEK